MNINNSNFASIDEMRHKINAAEQKTNQHQRPVKNPQRLEKCYRAQQIVFDFPNMRQDAWRQEIFL